MPKWEFRLRFNFSPGISINYQKELARLAIKTARKRLVLKGHAGKNIVDSEQLSILGSNYGTEEAAWDAARRARFALLAWATSQSSGLDLGDNRASSGATKFLTKRVAKIRQLPLIRNDVHGIDVFKSQKRKSAFLSMNANGVVARSSEIFANTFGEFYEIRNKIPPKVELACEIYCDSFFDKSPRTRFITMITAVEALLEPSKRSKAIIEKVNELLENVRSSALTKSERDVLLNGLGGQRKEAITETGRRLADLRLPNRIYLDKSPSQFFSYCYNVRSKLVHEGKSLLSYVELKNLANVCSGFVRELLIAEIERHRSIDNSDA